MKLERTSKSRAQFETKPQLLLLFSLFIYMYLRSKREMRLKPSLLLLPLFIDLLIKVTFLKL